MSSILYNSAKPLNLLFTVSDFYQNLTDEMLTNSLNFLLNERLKGYETVKFSIVEFSEGFVSIFIGDAKEMLKHDLQHKIISVPFAEVAGLISKMSLQKKFTFFSLKNLLNDEILKFTIIATQGSLEIPQVASFFLNKHKDVDGAIALGVIKKGATNHNYYVTTECMRGISKIALKHSIPFTTGIIDAESEEIIKERVSANGQDLGKKAVKTCLDIISLKRKMEIFF